jgi:NADH-quinone oxidoreductase subunit C
MATRDVVAALQEAFPELGIAAQPLTRYLDGRESDQRWVRVPADRLLDVMQFLYRDERCRCEQLCDVTCVDYLNFPDADDRFAVIYSLVSLTHNHRLWIKVFVNDPDPAVPSVTSIWAGANWREREQYDMFGITFTGHPDLRRILCAEHFEDHPLRKDYPLHGRGERENFPRLTRESA